METTAGVGEEEAGGASIDCVGAIAVSVADVGGAGISCSTGASVCADGSLLTGDAVMCVLDCSPVMVFSVAGAVCVVEGVGGAAN